MQHLVNRRVRRLAVAAALPVVLTALAAPGASASAGAAKITVVAQGLNNPRGLAFGEDGRLFVAEAGTGGASCLSGPRGAACFGTTGSISMISHGHVHRVTTGLASIAGPDGSGATGPDGLTSRDGALWTIITASPQQVPPGLPAGLTRTLNNQAGQLVKLGEDGGFRTVAGVGSYDWAWATRHLSLNPQYPDANPYGVLATENRLYVVDAGANTLDLVGENGRVSVLAVFPSPAVSDAVPTCIDQGPDGALYVGELTGGGNPPGSAVVWRVVPGHKPQVWHSGLSNITGCGFGPNGNFYVTEFQTQALGSPNPAGDVIRIAPNGTETSIGGGQIFLANGFAVGRDGAVYVSNWSVLPGTSTGGPTGEVVRISQ